MLRLFSRVKKTQLVRLLLVYVILAMGNILFIQ